jgi:hypothetical protein
MSHNVVHELPTQREKLKTYVREPEKKDGEWVVELVHPQVRTIEYFRFPTKDDALRTYANLKRKIKK